MLTMQIKYPAGVVFLVLLGTLVPSSPVYSQYLATSQSIWKRCTPTEVLLAPNRIQVRCKESLPNRMNIESAMNKIIYLAVPTANNKVFANRAMSLMSTALVAEKSLRVLYRPDHTASGPKFGCPTENCRPLDQAALLK